MQKWPELNLSDDANKLLEELKARKQKWDKLKAIQPVFAIVTAAFVFFFIYTFYRKVLVISGGNALAILDLVISNPLFSGSLLISISLFLFTRNRMNQIEKAKSKYEDLRIEAIERLDTSWLKDVKSESRDQISSFLHQEYDINIVHKS
ncbi:YpbF family protein [Paenibacillus sp. HWE-109]|uniref:DUF2663 family protein n=1 Tax=Paenibacillus sp. HWE-109 TaxID=1306526 RepID=UPI001EE13944|nr:DUF2663 family protein [Paenibacillus sp. HWE-109]UKS24260.1 YpbF family protein [Paenibacillus sp. HWE-109]